MKKLKRLIGILFILIIFLLSCENESPDLVPEVIAYPTPEIIMNETPVPTDYTSPSSTLIPTLTPEQTAETTPAAEVTTTPTEFPEQTPNPTPVTEPTATPMEFPEETSSPTENPVSGRIIITEIMYNPGSPDTEWEWIELYNGTDSLIDLSGWVVDDGNKTPHKSPNITSGIIPSHGTGILFNNDLITVIEFESAWREGINLIPVTDWGTMGLNNSGDKIGIWNSFDAYNGDYELFINALCVIQYLEESAWPEADGSASIYLTNLGADYTDGNQWALSSNGIITPLGICYQSISGSTNSGEDIGSP